MEMVPLEASTLATVVLMLAAGLVPLMAAMPSQPFGRREDAQPGQKRPDEEEILEEEGLPDGEDDREPVPAERRKLLAVVAGFSYLIILFLALLVIAIVYAAATR
jgi:hypothetical protein